MQRRKLKKAKIRKANQQNNIKEVLNLLKNKNIVLGVTGGIAAYKAPDIVSRLIKKGAKVKVVMTEAAEKFVTPLTFQTMSQNYVVSDMFADIPSWDVEHIAIAKGADLFLIAPASANIIGKIANGIADDMLSTTVMATKAPVVFAPAMNTNMYKNPIFQKNVESLKELGYRFISPASGRLACGDTGEGKLESPENIIKYIEEFFEEENLEKDFKGLKALVTAGPTIERVDPVRYVSNNSSGKMGYEIAKALKKRGADVTLISGPVNLEAPEGIKTVYAESTDDMFKAVEAEFSDSDIIVKAAAPLDYKIKSYSEEKIKKAGGGLILEFERAQDILKHFGNLKKENQTVVGFAAESEDLAENAKKKIEKKNLDFIVANNIKSAETGFKSDYNSAKIIDRDGKETDTGKVTKSELAGMILDKIKEIRRA